LKNGEVTLQYDKHNGTVNTINFIDNGERFITTSDDKSLRVWDISIPVVTKWITDPNMHAMPTAALHPKRSIIAVQSLDNTVQIFDTENKYKRRKKKVFSGHLCSGYSCQVGFSNDGKFLISGDYEGKAFFLGL